MPALIIFSMIGTVSASSIGAPNLLVPMWGGLFGSLGWNFLEYAFIGPDVVWGWLVCGVDVLGHGAAGVRLHGLPAPGHPSGAAAVLWLPAYGVLGAVGLLFGWWSFVAVAS